MNHWTYVAMDAKGAEQAGLIEAASQPEALAQLRSRGLFPTKLTEAQPEPPPTPQLSSPPRPWTSSAPKRR